jgi:hypothetical protein
VAVGKNIQQIYNAGQATYAEDLERYIRPVEEALQDNKDAVGPGIAAMADFQLKLLIAELSKIGPEEIPSASTITQVGDWLLENVPVLKASLTSLFSSKAAFHVISRSGDIGIKWLEERFKERG